MLVLAVGFCFSCVSCTTTPQSHSQLQSEFRAQSQAQTVSLKESLHKLRSASNVSQANRQAARIISQQVNRPIQITSKGLFRARATGSVKRAVKLLSFNQVVAINQALAALPGHATDARRKLLRAAASEHGWPKTLSGAQQSKALMMLSSLDNTPQNNASMGDTAKQLRQAISQKLLIVDIPASAAGLQYEAILAVRLSGKLSAKQREEALHALEKAVFAGGQADSHLSPATFRHALLAADSFGMADSKQIELVLRRINNAKTLDSATTYDLSYLLGFIQFANRPEVQSQAENARIRLLNQICNRVPRFTNGQRTEVDNLELAMLVGQALRATNGTWHQKLINALRSTFQSPQAAAAFMDQSTEAIKLINMPENSLSKLYTHILASWVLYGQNWQKASWLDQIMPLLAKAGSSKSKKAMLRIMNAAANNPVLGAQVMVLGSTAFKMLGSSFQEGFVSRMHKAAKTCDNLPLSLFINLAKIDSVSKSTDKPTNLLVDTLKIYHTRGGTIEGKFVSFQTLGNLVVKQNLSKALRKQLIAPTGAARLGMAKVLAWAYKNSAEAGKQWRDFLKSQVSNTNLSGDSRASWYLALSYVAKIAPTRLSASPGLNWVIKAYNAAQSDKLRLKCAKHIVLSYMDFEAFDDANKFLNKAKASLPGAAASKAFAELGKKVNQAKAKSEHRNRRIAVDRQIAGIKGSINHIQKLLTQAQKQNQSATNIKSLKTTISNLKQRLAEAQNSF